MCTLTGQYEKEIIVGYKYALKKGRKYYSPATSVEYKIGDVPIPKMTKKMYEPLDSSFIAFLLINSGVYDNAFKSNYSGFTSVFLNKEDAISLLKDSEGIKSGYKAVILKMTLKGDLKNGNYGIKDIVAGKEIVSFEEVVVVQVVPELVK